MNLSHSIKITGISESHLCKFRLNIRASKRKIEERESEDEEDDDVSEMKQDLQRQKKADVDLTSLPDSYHGSNKQASVSEYDEEYVPKNN